MKKKDKLDILYEDKNLIVINKKSGVLTISTDKESKNTLYNEVSNYEKKKDKKNKIFIVHRLDKDTSGLVIFAKNIHTKNILQEGWENVIRRYVAIVHGNTKEKEVLKSYLFETKTLQVFSTNNTKKGKLAITEYEKIFENSKYSLLNINIKTGRKNQIRVQLNDIKHPIVGDKKYGTNKDNQKRLFLHANFIQFKHPITSKIITIETSIPIEFNNLINMPESDKKLPSLLIK